MKDIELPYHVSNTKKPLYISTFENWITISIDTYNIRELIVHKNQIIIILTLSFNDIINKNPCNFPSIRGTSPK